MSKPENAAPLWSSLEIAKIIVGVLTPVAILVFGARLSSDQAAEAAERERFAQVVKHRAELWSEIAPKMNDLYCYFLYVGHWKEIGPEETLALKRALDKTVYANRPFFSDEFHANYLAFMEATFATYNAWGEDAKLKTQPIRKLDRGRESMFKMEAAGGYAENSTAIHNAYYAWLKQAAREMDLDVSIPDKPTTPSAEEIESWLR